MFTLDAAMEAPGEIGWVLTLVIVSVLSAAIGAVIMIIVLHCRRVQNSREHEGRSNNPPRNSTRNGNRPPINTPDDKTISTITTSTFPGQQNPHAMTNNGVWSWLSCKSTPVPSQLNSPTSPAENHYTHMDEALYAELDQESNVDSSSPAYQNSAYTDPDAPSAPSSAYYSDLSVTTVPERAYEVVGLSILPTWDNSNNSDRRQPPRLASISETVSVPSDYV